MEELFVFVCGVLLGLCILFGSITINNHLDNQSIERLVASGVHPMDAYYAIRGHSSNVMCSIRGAQK